MYRYYFTAEQKGRHSIEWISETDDADDPDGAGDWLWRHEASGEGGEESTQAEALAAAQQHADDTVPSDAAAGVPAAENIVRTLFLRRRHRGPDPPRAIRPVSSPRAEARPSPRLGPPQERCR